MVEDHPEVEAVDEQIAAVDHRIEQIKAAAVKVGEAVQEEQTRWRVARNKAVAAGKIPPAPPEIAHDTAADALRSVDREKRVLLEERQRVLARVRPDVEAESGKAMAELMGRAAPVVEAFLVLVREADGLRRGVREVRSAADRCSEVRRYPGDAERTGGRVSAAELLDAVLDGTDLLALAPIVHREPVVQVEHGLDPRHGPFGPRPDMTPVHRSRQGEI